MKKKIVSLLLASTTLCLTACGGSDGKKDGSASANNQLKDVLSSKPYNIIIESVDSDREGQGMISLEEMDIVTNGVDTQKLYCCVGNIHGPNNDVYISYLDGDYGLLKLDGTVIIEYGTYEYLEWYDDNYINFRTEARDNNHGIMDTEGNIIVPAEYSFFNDYGASDEMIEAVNKDRDYHYYSYEGALLLKKNKNDENFNDYRISHRFYNGYMSDANYKVIDGEVGAYALNEKPVIYSTKTGEAIFTLTGEDDRINDSAGNTAIFEYYEYIDGDDERAYGFFNADFTKVHIAKEVGNTYMIDFFSTPDKRILISQDDEMFIYDTEGNLLKTDEDVSQAWIYNDEFYYVKTDNIVTVLDDAGAEKRMGIFSIYNSEKLLLSDVINGDTERNFQFTGTYNEAEKKFENHKLVDIKTGDVIYDTDEIQSASLSDNYLTLKNGNNVTFTATKIYEHNADEHLYKEYEDYAVFRYADENGKLTEEFDIIRTEGDNFIYKFDLSEYNDYTPYIYVKDSNTDSDNDEVYSIYGELIYTKGEYDEED